MNPPNELKLCDQVTRVLTASSKVINSSLCVINSLPANLKGPQPTSFWLPLKHRPSKTNSKQQTTNQTCLPKALVFGETPGVLPGPSFFGLESWVPVVRGHLPGVSGLSGSRRSVALVLDDNYSVAKSAPLLKVFNSKWFNTENPLVGKQNKVLTSKQNAPKTRSWHPLFFFRSLF